MNVIGCKVDLFLPTHGTASQREQLSQLRYVYIKLVYSVIHPWSLFIYLSEEKKPVSNAEHNVHTYITRCVCLNTPPVDWLDGIVNDPRKRTDKQRRVDLVSWEVMLLQHRKDADRSVLPFARLERHHDLGRHPVQKKDFQRHVNPEWCHVVCDWRDHWEVVVARRNRPADLLWQVRRIGDLWHHWRMASSSCPRVASLVADDQHLQIT